MTRAPILLALLSACVASPSPVRMPVSAGLDGAVLTFAYADGTTCTLTAPPGLPLGESWTDPFADCPGMVAVEVSLWRADPDSVILRMADIQGPLTLSGLPPLASGTVWAAHPEGFWAEYSGRP